MQETVNKLLRLTEDSVSKFVESVTPIQRQTYKRIIELSKELDVYVNGTLKNNLTNIKIVGGIRSELEKIILSDSYLKNVKEFTDAYSTVEKLQNKYFSDIALKFSPKALFKEVKNIAIENTVESLTESGIANGYINGVRDILQTNVTSGGSYADMTKDLSAFILGDENLDGALLKYAKNTTTDAINQFSATYNKIVSDDLGLVFYQYVGSLITTSREFCRAMVDKRYFHISEVEELLKGHVDNVNVLLNKNTGLPQGMIEGTNTSTFFINRGGWGCGHQIFPVATSSVPEEIVKEFI